MNSSAITSSHPNFSISLQRPPNETHPIFRINEIMDIVFSHLPYSALAGNKRVCKTFHQEIDQILDFDRIKLLALGVTVRCEELAKSGKRDLPEFLNACKKHSEDVKLGEESRVCIQSPLDRCEGIHRIFSAILPKWSRNNTPVSTSTMHAIFLNRIGSDLSIRIGNRSFSLIGSPKKESKLITDDGIGGVFGGLELVQDCCYLFQNIPFFLANTQNSDKIKIQLETECVRVQKALPLLFELIEQLVQTNSLIKDEKDSTGQTLTTILSRLLTVYNKIQNFETKNKTNSHLPLHGSLIPNLLIYSEVLLKIGEDESAKNEFIALLKNPKIKSALSVALIEIAKVLDAYPKIEKEGKIRPLLNSPVFAGAFTDNFARLLREIIYGTQMWVLTNNEDLPIINSQITPNLLDSTNKLRQFVVESTRIIESLNPGQYISPTNSFMDQLKIAIIGSRYVKIEELLQKIKEELSLS